MKKFYYIFLILVSVMAVSCSEDGVTPHLKDTTLAFLPAADDNSEEAQLRRDFYQTYGSFLLFNDTLQHEALGKDVNGDMHYFTEVLDLNYQVGMSTSSNEKFKLIPMTDMENQGDAFDRHGPETCRCAVHQGLPFGTFDRQVETLFLVVGR